MLCGRSDHSDVALRQECKTIVPLVSPGVRVGRYHSDGCIRGAPNLGNPRRLAHQLYRAVLFRPSLDAESSAGTATFTQDPLLADEPYCVHNPLMQQQRRQLYGITDIGVQVGPSPTERIAHLSAIIGAAHLPHAR